MKLPRVKVWRESQGLTQRELADEAGITYTTLARIEMGNSAIPSTARKLAKALGITVADLIEHPPVPLGPPPGSAVPSLDLAAMSRATHQERRRALGAASDAEVGEYVRGIDQALERSADWGKDEQDQAALAAYRAFLGDLRDEASPFVVVSPTPQQRAAVAVHSRVATSTAG